MTVEPDGRPLQRSPLDAEHRSLGATMVAVRRVGDADRVPDRARSRSIWRAATGRWCSTCRTSAPCGSRDPMRFDRLQCDAHQRPRQDRARPGPVHPPARRRRRLGARRHHRVVAPATIADAFDVMPNASNTDRRARRDRRRRHHRTSEPSSRCRGPTPRRWCRRCSRRRRRSVASGWRRSTGSGVELHRRRHRLHRRGRRRDRGARRVGAVDCGERSSTPASRRPGSAHATRCASRAAPAAARSRARTRDHARSRPVWAGWSRGTSRPSSVATRSIAERDRGIRRRLVGIATDGRRPAACRVLGLIDRRRRRRRGDQRQLLAGARPRDRTGVRAARHARRAPRSIVDVRGKELPVGWSPPRSCAADGGPAVRRSTSSQAASSRRLLRRAPLRRRLLRRGLLRRATSWQSTSRRDVLGRRLHGDRVVVRIAGRGASGSGIGLGGWSRAHAGAGRLPGIRNPPKSPPADSASCVSGPSRLRDLGQHVGERAESVRQLRERRRRQRLGEPVQARSDGHGRPAHRPASSRRRP